MSVLQADLILLLLSALWGGGFPATKWALATMQPCTFIAWRFLFATLVLVLVFPRKVLPRTRFDWLVSGAMGTFIGLGYMCQTIGQQYMSTGKAGFITGLTIVFVPLIDSIATGKFISRKNLLGIATSVCGLALLSINERFDLAVTDLWVVGCAFLFAFQIYGVSRWGTKLPVIAFTTIQLLCAGLVAAICAFLWESPMTGFSPTTWKSLAYTSVIATSLTFVIQTKVQPFTSSTHAALIYALEAVFATLMGWAWLNEHLTPRDILGCTLIGLGIVIVELRIGRRRNDLGVAKGAAR